MCTLYLSIRTFFITACILLSVPALAVLPYGNTGNIYVSMWTSDEVAVFSPEGKALGRFTANGLEGPRGIAFNPANGEIWVAAEDADAIFIFDYKHRFLKQLDHVGFDGPTGVTFASKKDVKVEDQEVYIVNSDADSIMVFGQDGQYLREFTDAMFADPNCLAVMPDESFFVTNRLWNSQGSLDKFDGLERYKSRWFDHGTQGMPGMVSVMAVARDPNAVGDSNDTVWVSSGGGSRALYEYDLMGNLLQTILPSNIKEDDNIIPQGIAFDDQGNFYVASMTNFVYKFDGEGNYLMRFSTGGGTSRSLAMQACKGNASTPRCDVLGTVNTSSASSESSRFSSSSSLSSGASNSSSSMDASSPSSESSSSANFVGVISPSSNLNSDSGSGGSLSRLQIILLIFIVILAQVRRFRIVF